MPVLAAETSIFPESLLDQCDVEYPERSWWAVYTKARQEKALARQLLQREIPFYLPLIPKENIIRGRRVQSHIPLFGGYVFLFASDQERVGCLATNRTSNVFPVIDGEQLRHDLQQVHRLIAADAPLTVERRLMPGQRVRIKGGSMMGLEGTVVMHRSKTRLIVDVEFLQQGVSMEVDGFHLEPLS